MISIGTILDHIDEAKSQIMSLLQAEGDEQVPLSDTIDSLYRGWELLKAAEDAILEASA